MKPVQQAMIYLFFGFLLSACTDDENAEKEPIIVIKETTSIKEVQLISKNDFKLNDNNAVTITAGPSPEKVITISLYLSNIKEGYAVSSLSNSEPSIELKAEWEGLTFTQSELEESSVNLEVLSVDYQNLIAELLFSATLIAPDTKERLVITESKLEAGGFNFYTLTREAPEPIEEEPTADEMINEENNTEPEKAA